MSARPGLPDPSPDAGEASPFEVVRRLAREWPVTAACEAVGVSRSGYYAWRERTADGTRKDGSRARDRLREAIRATFEASKGTYGSPRVHASLKAAGTRCSRRRVAGLMREAGLRATRTRGPRRARPRAGATAPPVPALVRRCFRPADVGAPDRAWHADVTSIRTREGWLHLAVVLDAFSRRVLGWATGTAVDADLVVEAFEMALHRRRPARGVIHHSDRGSPYASDRFQARAGRAGVVRSMGRAGTCLDNAVVESFFATMKAELVRRQSWRTRGELAHALFAYVEAWYNRHRLHGTLGYLSPVAFEEAHATSR